MNILIVDKQAYLFSDHECSSKAIETTKRHHDFSSFESSSIICKFSLLTYLREFTKDHLYTIHIYLASRWAATYQAKLISYSIDKSNIAWASEAEFLVLDVQKNNV